MQGPRKVSPSIPCCQLGIHLVAILSIFLSACSTLEAENPQLETATVCGTTTVVQRKLSLSASNQSNPKLSCAAFKGNTSTRWLNAFADLQWVQTNLSGVQPIYGVTHEWEQPIPRPFSSRCRTTVPPGRPSTTPPNTSPPPQTPRPATCGCSTRSGPLPTATRRTSLRYRRPAACPFLQEQQLRGGRTLYGRRQQ